MSESSFPLQSDVPKVVDSLFAVRFRGRRFLPPLASAAASEASLARMWAAEALRGQSPRKKEKSRSLLALSHVRGILLKKKVC